MIWRWISPDGSCCDFKTEVIARQLEKASPGSRVVELAPVDPLERAVVEAAISVAEGLREGCSLTRMQIWQRQGVLLSAVDALIAARKDAP